MNSLLMVRPNDYMYMVGRWAREAKKEKEFTESELAAEALKKRWQEKKIIIIIMYET